MNRNLLIIIGLLVLAFVGLIAFNRDGEEAVAAEPSQHIYGEGGKQVTLIEYADFQCPACYDYEPTMQAIREKYKDEINFQFRNFPLAQIHPNALAAHAAAEAASRQGKFWEYHDLLYEEQKSWSTVSTNERSAVFEQYATQLELDLEQFRADIGDPGVRAIINADIKEGKSIGATGTPTFVLNGKKLDKISADVDAFSKLIDEELSKL